jgi:hypothetical protein
MTRYEAKNVIYDVINSGIISEDLEENLVEVANCICDNGFEICPEEYLRYCKRDECDNAEECKYDDEDEEIDELPYFIPKDGFDKLP